jgi:hypothetical protein
MKTSVVLGLLLAAAAPCATARAEAPERGAARPAAVPAPDKPSDKPGSPDPVVRPKRAKITCAQYRANAEKTAPHAIIDTRLKVGSWGRVPPELRKLPPHSKLCGADGRGQVVIASPLFGKEIESHYTPLFTKVGFQPLACTVEPGRTQCTSKRRRDLGIVITDQDTEAFVLAVMKR